MVSTDNSNRDNVSKDSDRRAFMKGLVGAAAVAVAAFSQSVFSKKLDAGSGDSTDSTDTTDSGTSTKPEQHEIRITAPGSSSPKNYYLRTLGPISNSQIDNPDTGTQ
jgi:hypothetical protein